ncbi:MAG: site-specific integrase, partial [Ktedonobacteraceae bacterium]|nr:site-specific integrase [Ktedonobacteraceae bacterium]
HILPAIGHLQLQKLTTQQVQALYAQKMKEGYAPETIHSIHKILHRAFDDAVRWKRMSYNVCGRGKVTLPRIELQDIHPLSREEAQALLAAVKGHWYLEALLTLAVATGMRRGELLALKWEDVDFQEGRLFVRQGLRRKKGQGLVVSRPKTEKSRRQIFLPKFVVEILRVHRERQDQMRRQAGSQWKGMNVVFSDEHGGFIEPVRFHRHFKKVLKLAGLPDVRIHDLRHTAATLLLRMGVHPKLVQELLGHSDIRTTLNRYSHVQPSMQREMMDNFHQFFEEP